MAWFVLGLTRVADEHNLVHMPLSLKVRNAMAMKTNHSTKRWFSNAADCILIVLSVALVSPCPLAMAGVTNKISTWLADGTINWGVWGAETNELCAGVNFVPLAQKHSNSGVVSIYVLTSKTNELWNYLTPPDGILAKLELRGPNGSIVGRKWLAKKMDGELPGIIQRRDLAIDERHGLFKNQLLLLAGRPHSIRDFNIKDIYSIKEEGDYMLTVCVAVYEFAPDRNSAMRVDLPCVTTKIHLVPAQEN